MPSAATWMQLEIIIQGKSDRQILYGITYMWNLKYDTNESMKTQKNHGHREQTSGYQGGEGVG